MASLSNDGGADRWRVTFDEGGRRRTVRLGRVPKRVAAQVKYRVESLLACKVGRLPLDADTAAWVAHLGDDLHARLAAVGLLTARQSEALGPFLAAYLARRRADSKGATVANLNTVANDLLGFFGPALPLREVTERRADEYRTDLLTRTGSRKLAPATVARRLKTVKQLFDHARKLKLVPENPFADVTAPGSTGQENQHYVTPADTRRLLETCDPVWRLMVALSRFGGLRNPSETLLLKWEGVDLPGGRMTVDSPKTEHHPGKAYRVVPIFPELRPFLEEAWELVGEGAEFVVSGPLADHCRYRSTCKTGWTGVSLATRLAKRIRRAGLAVWPRPFHNLRASCETDLMKTFPIHVVTRWIGNSPTVALRHYLQVTDADYERASRGGGEAARNPARSDADTGGQFRGSAPAIPCELPSSPVLSGPVFSSPFVMVGGKGVEPLTPGV